MNFGFYAHVFEYQAHGGTQVLQGIDGRYREVTALDAGTMAQVTGLGLFALAPLRFFGTDFVEGFTHAVFPADVVEDEELVFGAEIGSIGNARGLHVFFGAASDRARVTLITLHGGRFDDVTGDIQSGFFTERVHHGSAGVRHHDHVGFVNAFPAFDGRAVEHFAVFESGFFNGVGRHGHVLFLTTGICETEINEFDIVVFYHF